MSPQVDCRQRSLLSADFVFWIWVLFRSRSFLIPPLCISSSAPSFPCDIHKISPQQHSAPDSALEAPFLETRSLLFVYIEICASRNGYWNNKSQLLLAQAHINHGFPPHAQIPLIAGVSGGDCRHIAMPVCGYDLHTHSASSIQHTTPTRLCTWWYSGQPNSTKITGYGESSQNSLWGVRTLAIAVSYQTLKQAAICYQKTRGVEPRVHFYRKYFRVGGWSVFKPAIGNYPTSKIRKFAWNKVLLLP